MSLPAQTPSSVTVPAPPSVASLSIPERMAAVIRQQAHQGQPTTRDDFHQALETCDLSDAQLDAHIGEAKRLVHPEVVRQDSPPTGIAPWDFLPDYRRERVALAASLVNGLLPGDDVAVATLRSANFSNQEIAALWPEIIREVRLRPVFGAEPPANLATVIGRINAMNAVRRAKAEAGRDPRVRVTDLSEGATARPFECRLSALGLEGEEEEAAIGAELHAKGTAIVGGGAAPAYRLELIA